MKITTRDDLKEYLWANGIAFEDITELTGGTANFVWRVVEKSGRIYIVKHAEAYIKDAVDFAFPVERMDFEARALATLPDILNGQPGSELVRPVALLHYDTNMHVLMLEDGGERNLKAAYADPSLDVCAYGSALGHWIASLHRGAVEHHAIGDNVTARAIYRHAYRNLAGALQQHMANPEEGAALGRRVDEEYGSLLATEDDTVCHGDFWTGNILIGEDGRLAVVDWEIVRRGNGATDVGQFAAEAFLLDRFRGGRGLLDAFLEAYAKDASPSFSFAKRVAIHFGTHIGFWTTQVQWGTSLETKELVRFGAELLNRTLVEDWDWLRESPLKNIIPA